MSDGKKLFGIKTLNDEDMASNEDLLNDLFVESNINCIDILEVS